MDNVISLDLQSSITSLESTATNFGIRFIADASLREEYNKKSKELSRELLNNVKNGNLSTHDAAKKASAMRNILMDAMRGKTSEIARAYASNIKTQGYPLPFLEEKYAKQSFGKPFHSLDINKKNKIWKEIVFASGRPQSKTNNLAKTMGKAGKGFIALTIAISIYNISTADDKLLASAKESGVISSGLLGSVTGGALAGLACGPGAPVCVSIGVFVGGVMFAIGAEVTFNSLWN